MKATATLLAAVIGCASGAITFSDHIQDHMILQRAPQKAAVHGTLETGSEDAPITVTAKVATGTSTYSVEGTVDGDQWVAYLKPSEAGGNYSITVTCDGCSQGNNTISVYDVTFGDVWYCAGQSNMALNLHHTVSRNKSLDLIQSGKYSNIRIYSMASNMNPNISWTTLKNATNTPKRHSGNLFFAMSATCYYFAESLTDIMGAAAPPIGLIHTAVGGSKAEQWTSNTTSAKCANVTLNGGSQKLFDARVKPFAKTTIKGFLWYQGENDMGELFGNSERSTGYACEVPNMIAEWRATLSKEPNTTSPEAPFGLVTLAPTGSEGHPDMGGMYAAQMGSYGNVPNAAMPNTFLAHAFDLGDPWSNTTCYHNGCCDNFTLPKCHGCEGFCDSCKETNFYMGAIHSRDKKPLGDRLAQAAYGSVYGGTVPVRGPVLSGCSLSNGKLTITFNKTLLGSQSVIVGDYQRDRNASMVQILTNSSLFCMQMDKDAPAPGEQSCRDNGEGEPFTVQLPKGKRGIIESSETWPMVNITSSGPNSVVADVSEFGDNIFAVRYAFFTSHVNCCAKNTPTSGPCPIASCPLKASGLGNLPANPFVAKIINGKCECLPPQVCDE
eukprot:TRINITY_DN5040_c0_g2_i2.p1 TRINITY_DN5040_c0_g2~~TRINITY_DN5040_c0_g2_i2.p1  ORF type:complete len:610 (+),score=126.46 TRINITY_DN5040_c0_g2_i2:77-1906(+)